MRTSPHKQHYILHHPQNIDKTVNITGQNEVVAKVIFLHLFVILFTGGWWYPRRDWGRSPPGSMPPPRSKPPGSRPPRTTPPPPPGSRHPPQTRPPLREADSGIRFMSGRYASYWNAFLLPLYRRHLQPRLSPSSPLLPLLVPSLLQNKHNSVTKHKLQ